MVGGFKTQGKPPLNSVLGEGVSRAVSGRLSRLSPGVQPLLVIFSASWAGRCLQPTLSARKRRAGTRSSQQPYKAGTPGRTRLERSSAQFSYLSCRGSHARRQRPVRGCFASPRGGLSPPWLLAGVFQKPASSLLSQQAAQHAFNYSFSLLSSERFIYLF